ncbi:transcription factor Cys6 [Beauveria brongniartii RCEF 3172]|uniref:Transcription factor Cys6 n=1 Tax=Beauveria brongniartii RCEF 3172 TaxID=1081107 RepID=A0A166S0Z6_9HYPO|nr:transcription factor Cys6 [Beauveria brongniartii RCEF 3172]
MFRLLETSNDLPVLAQRRKRPIVSCTECHQRKQKCDRQQPCNRCIKREIPDKCRYEVPDTQRTFDNISVSEPDIRTTPNISSSLRDDVPIFAGTGAEALVSTNLGYSSRITGTPGLIRSIGVVIDEYPDAGSSMWLNGDAALQYRNLLRQLPSKRHINMLVSFFYSQLSWQYEIVDDALFRQYLHSWDQVPYTARNQPVHLPASLRHFPALLFQLLALALLFQPMQYDESLRDLCHAPGMDLADVASELSDAGWQISALFASSEVTMPKVQAGLLRACFLKTTGSVARAWHTLGQTIRHAQELGLHRLTESDEFCVDQSQVQQAQEARVGRKLWLVLHLWDGHMAVVLDRPMATRLNPESAPCADVGPNRLLGSDDLAHVTPFNMILCGYHAAYKFLQEIHNLSSATSDAGGRADEIHSAIMLNVDLIPEWAQLKPQNFDGDFPWLRAARETLYAEIHFTLLALHRPFIFQRSHSRAQAFTAATRILESQRRLLGFIEPTHYPSFNLVFATFDAAVIVAATHILFPNESRGQIQQSLGRLQWALNNFHAMRGRNRLAETAYSVTKAMCGKVINCTSVPQPSLERNEDSGASGGSLGEPSDVVTQLSFDTVQQIVTSSSFEGISPPQPLRDLVFQDYTAALPPPDIPTHTMADYPSAQFMIDDEFWKIIHDLGG